MIDLSGRTALVTGGGRGVGRAIAMVLAQQGADVAIGEVSMEHAEAVAAEIKKLGRRSMALNLDVSSRDAAMSAASKIVSEWGHIDILVNNAGVAGGNAATAGDVVATWNWVLGINLMGVINCTDAVLPHMAKKRYGKVVNIASTAGRSGDPIGNNEPAPDGAEPSLGGSAYAASKAAVIRQTQGYAGVGARFNINVNCVCPSRMTTDMGLNIAAGVGRRKGETLSSEEVLEQRRQAVRQNNRFGRELEPVDIANAVAFLVSEEAKNITGTSLNVDGGFKMI